MKKMIGMFGHIYEGDILQYQFHIIDYREGYYAVQFFDFIMGEPSHIKNFTLDELLNKKIRLYPDNDTMLRAYEINGNI